MKFLGKKIPKGNSFLFISFAAVSLCILVIVSAVRAERLNALSQNGFYTGHEVEFSVSSSEDEDGWADVISELAAQYRDFSLCLPIKDPEIVIRGIYINGNVYDPPMLSGDFFDTDASWSDSPKMVIGKDCEKDAYTKDDKKYYTYEGEEYEVIGIMGTEEDSRINHMIWMDFRSAVRLAGINTEYVLDAREKTEIPDVGKAIYNSFRSPAQVWISLNGTSEGSFLSGILSSEQIVKTMYMVILISFSLSTILVTIIWLRFRRRLFFAWKLCGYEPRSIMLETAKRYYRITGLGFAVGCALMCLLERMAPGIGFMPMDAVISFGMTLLLGTLVLAVCYMHDRLQGRSHATGLFT